MCGRFVSPEEAAIERAFHLGRRSRPNPFVRRFNVFPTDTIALLRRPSDAEELELAAGRWGLVPHWWKEAKPPRSSHIARVEEASGKPMWRDAWARARCLVPAEGWYEWQAVERADPASGEIKRAKQPYFIRRADGELCCFAGLMSYRKEPGTGGALRSCAIVTIKAEGPLAAIHERSPLVLPESAHADWLDRKLTDPREVNAVAAARVPPDEFTPWKVRQLINNTRLDGPELIEPMEEGEEPGPERPRD
ncbi:MAG: SOS response-associated peptidase [Burkholderiales bacterium]